MTHSYANRRSGHHGLTGEGAQQPPRRPRGSNSRRKIGHRLQNCDKMFTGVTAPGGDADIRSQSKNFALPFGPLEVAKLPSRHLIHEKWNSDSFLERNKLSSYSIVVTSCTLSDVVSLRSKCTLRAHQRGSPQRQVFGIAPSAPWRQLDDSQVCIDRDR